MEIVELSCKKIDHEKKWKLLNYLVKKNRSWKKKEIVELSRKKIDHEFFLGINIRFDRFLKKTPIQKISQKHTDNAKINLEKQYKYILRIKIKKKRILF